MIGSKLKYRQFAATSSIVTIPLHIQ